MPTTNDKNIDFNFFSKDRKQPKIQFCIYGNRVKLNFGAYRAIGCPIGFKAGVDVENRKIYIEPVDAIDIRGAIYPTKAAIRRYSIEITSSCGVVDKMKALNIPNKIDVDLIDGRLVFSF